MSKILFIISKHPAYSRSELIAISIRSSIVAFLILVTLSAIGDFLFVKIFHIETYSLSVAGGVILFLIGLNAIKNGSFSYTQQADNSQPDVSIAPLAIPLIAGAGTMTASISFALMNGIIATILCIFIALLINLACMLLSFQINRALVKLHATDPFTRIIGLIITAVAAQMILSGCAAWVNRL